MRYDFSTNFQLFLGCVCDLLQQLSNKQKFTPKNKENVSNSPLWTKKNCWKFVGVHNFSVGRGFENLLTQLLFSTNFQHICWKFVEEGQIAYTLFLVSVEIKWPVLITKYQYTVFFKRQTRRATLTQQCFFQLFFAQHAFRCCDVLIF